MVENSDPKDEKKERYDPKNDPWFQPVVVTLPVPPAIGIPANIALVAVVAFLSALMNGVLQDFDWCTAFLFSLLMGSLGAWICYTQYRDPFGRFSAICGRILAYLVLLASVWCFLQSHGSVRF